MSNYYPLIIASIGILVIIGKTIFKHLRKEPVDTNINFLLTSYLLLIFFGEILEDSVLKTIVILLFTIVFIIVSYRRFQQNKDLYEAPKDRAGKIWHCLLFSGILGLVSLVILVQFLKILKLSPIWAIYLAYTSIILIIVAFIGKIITAIINNKQIS